MSVSNHQLIENFKAGKIKKGHILPSGESSRMFYEGDTLYSFGRHFPLLVKTSFGYLLNADRRSNTTSRHQGYCRHDATIQIPFSALEAAGIPYKQFRLVDKTAERYDLIGYYRRVDTGKKKSWGGAVYKTERITVKQYNALPNKEDKSQWHEYTERRPEACVIDDRGTYYLSSMDGANYFICELPEKCDTVEEAFQSLLPKNLNGREYIRQGEWFFVEWDGWQGAKKIYRDMFQKFVLPKTNPSSNSHTATRGMCTNGGNILVSGRVFHREHRTTILSKLPNIKIFEALENRAVHSWSASGRVD